MPTRNPVSSANFLGHPIHPMVVLFPVAFFVATFASDIVFWRTSQEIWAYLAIWLLGAALVMAALAAFAGLTDFIGDQRIRQISDAWQHAIGNVVAVLISLFSFYERYRYGSSVVAGPVARRCLHSPIHEMGWKGGELVFRHRVAVYDERRPRAVDQSGRRLPKEI